MEIAGSNPVALVIASKYYKEFGVGHLRSVAYKDPLDERAREARRKHYRQNKAQYVARNQKAKEEKIAFVRAQKDVPCMDCGVPYPYYVMEFDHRDPSQKLANIGRLLGNSWKRLKDEIAKCDVVCANCHRERTHGSVPLGGGESPKLTE